MVKKEKQSRVKENATPTIMHESDPGSLKDNPVGETVCSAYFSKGCINEDTDTSTLNKEDDDNEKY